MSNIVSVENSAQTSSLILDAASMNNIVNFAEFMCKAVITVPKHLQGNSGDCLAVTMQAMQWGMNPFAVAQKTHLVNGVLGYEAQLVNAVIISRAPIKSRPDYQWFGDWSKVDGKTCKSNDIGVTVFVCLNGEDTPRQLSISFAQVGVRNSPNWLNDPKQQIAYLAIKKLARLHFPDVLLGVYTEDELQDSQPVSQTVFETDVVDDLYVEFERQYLNQFRDEAGYGTERLESFYKSIPVTDQKKQFWATHSADLKEIAQFADNAISKQVKEENVIEHIAEE